MRKIIEGFIGGDAVFVEAAGLLACLEYGIAANDNNAPSDRHAGEIGGLPQIGNPANRVDAAGNVLIFKAERVNAGKAKPEENGIMAVTQAGKVDVVAKRLAIFDRDSTDRQDEYHFPLRKIIEGFIDCRSALGHGDRRSSPPPRRAALTGPPRRSPSCRRQ